MRPGPTKFKKPTGKAGVSAGFLVSACVHMCACECERATYLSFDLIDQKF